MRLVHPLAETDLYCEACIGPILAEGDLPRGPARREVQLAAESGFHDLIGKLSREVAGTHGKVKRVAIHAHGLPGTVHVNGGSKPQHAAAISDELEAAVALLRAALTEDAIVVLVGCHSGRGEAGDRLVVEVFSPLEGPACGGA